MVDYNTRLVIHTDSVSGVKRLATIHDTNPGRHGYTGIIYNDTNESEFVEDHEILTDEGFYNVP